MTLSNVLDSDGCTEESSHIASCTQTGSNPGNKSSLGDCKVSILEDVRGSTCADSDGHMAVTCYIVADTCISTCVLCLLDDRGSDKHGHIQALIHMAVGSHLQDSGRNHLDPWHG